jgi:3D (Asp-Asp-Asp) domain-containing protein
MKSRWAAGIRSRVAWKFNRLLIFANKVRMSAVIAARAVPQALTAGAATVRREAAPRTVVPAIVLLAMICVPTWLYTVERARHEGLQEAYRSLSFRSAAETSFLRQTLGESLQQQEQLEEALLDAGSYIHTGRHVTVKVLATGYSSTPFQTDSTPFITAHNTPTREGVLAMSRDLLRNYTADAPFTFGDRVHIDGVGDFLVEDSMNARWQRRVDIWFPSKMEARRFGVHDVYLTAIVGESKPDTPEGTEGGALTATASGL